MNLTPSRLAACALYLSVVASVPLPLHARDNDAPADKYTTVIRGQKKTGNDTSEWDKMNNLNNSSNTGTAPDPQRGTGSGGGKPPRGQQNKDEEGSPYKQMNCEQLAAAQQDVFHREQDLKTQMQQQLATQNGLTADKKTNEGNINQRASNENTAGQSYNECKASLEKLQTANNRNNPDRGSATTNRGTRPVNRPSNKPKTALEKQIDNTQAQCTALKTQLDQAHFQTQVAQQTSVEYQRGIDQANQAIVDLQTQLTAQNKIYDEISKLKKTCKN